MSKTYWTSSQCWGDSVLLRGVENGRRFKRKVKYKPTLYVPTAADSATHRTVDDQPVGSIQFDSIRDAKAFLRENPGYVHGYDKWSYVFLAEEYPGKVEYDPGSILVAYLDIETMADDGFPDLETANKEVTAITLKVGERIMVFGCRPYSSDDERVIYFLCRNEADLLQRFLEVWSHPDVCPDIVSGWNIEGFDIPYLVVRIRGVLGEDAAKRLSPWKVLTEKSVFSMGRDRKVYNPLGIAVLDYQRLYHKLAVMTKAVDTPDDYKLNTIAHVELGEKKIDYSEFESLHDMYLNDWKKYLDYNVHDVLLVEKINEKRQLIELVMAMAYNAKVNFEDMLGSVKPWECILHHKLLERGVVLPPRGRASSEELVGAFVKDPAPSGYDWVVSFDLNSLYSHLIMQWNISPETRVGEMERRYSVDEILDGAYERHLDEFRAADVVVAANGKAFTRKKKGYLPLILEEMYANRKIAKANAIRAEDEYERTKRPELLREIAKWKNMDKVEKTNLNAAYGVLTNAYFLFYDHGNAEAITTSGQLAIRWVEREVNRWINGTLGTDGVDYIIAMDTDSIYVNMGPLVKKVFPDGAPAAKVCDFLDKLCGGKMEEVIESGYQELARTVNAAEQKMVMKRETICFLGSTRVETKRGRVPIKDIVVGDEVLTHEGRYRRVVRTMVSEHRGDMVEINYGRRRGRGSEYVQCTPLHPIWVERGGVRQWVAAEDVEVGDTVFTLSSTCPKTGDTIPYWCKRSNRWNAVADDPDVRKKAFGNRPSPREFKRGVDLKKYKHRDNDIVPFCRDMQKQGWTMVPIDPVAIPDAIGFKDGKIVAFEIEKTTGRYLDFKKEKYADSVIPEFVDEIEWIEKPPTRKESRSCWYEDAGNGFVKVKVTWIGRKPIKRPYGRNVEKVYNLEVEGDHTYVAGRLVVHNCDRGIWTGKKHYILNMLDEEGVRFSEPKIKIKGMAAVKSSTPPACREKIKEAVKIIMTGAEADVTEFATRFREEFDHLPFHEIAFPRSVSDIEKWESDVGLYKSGTPIQVRAALLYRRLRKKMGLTHYPEVFNGDKIKFAYLRTPNPITENVFGTPGPLMPGVMEYVDRDAMFEKGFMVPLQSILEAIGWKVTSEDSSTLEEFFVGG